MLTGRRMFAGEERTDVLAAVLRQEIDWNASPVDTPPRLRRLLERCLDRDPKRRLRDIGEARIVLDDLPHDASHWAHPGVARAGAPSVARAPIKPSLAVAAAVAMLVLGAAIGRFAWQTSRRMPVSMASSIAFERSTFQPGHFVNARFAPDGQTVSLSAAWRGPREIFQCGRAPVTGRAPEVEPPRVTIGGARAFLPRVETGNPYVNYGRSRWFPLAGAPV